MACGTGSLLDAAFGPATAGQTSYARRLVSSLQAGMLLPGDRNIAAGWLAAAVSDTGAHLLVQARTGRGGPKLPVLHRLGHGSYRSMFAGMPVRVIDAQITITTAAGRATGTYRLVTTLLEHARYPTSELITLHHDR